MKRKPSRRARSRPSCSRLLLRVGVGTDHGSVPMQFTPSWSYALGVLFLAMEDEPAEAEHEEVKPTRAFQWVLSRTWNRRSRRC